MNELRNHFITTARPYQEGAVEVFEQNISAAGVRSAKLTITALGLYHASIDGVKAGDAFFTPGYTYYPKELQYDTYDVTGLLNGNSVLRVELGQGWYCGRFGFENKTQIYGERPAVSWILEIETGEGVRYYCSDDAGVRAVTSPYRYAGFYDGEIYDPAGNGEPVWPPVRYEGTLPEHLEPTILSVRKQEEIPVKEVFRYEDHTIVDFGQNFAGMITIDPSKMEGEVMTVRHGEILNADGSLYTVNLRKAKAQIVYTKGNSAEVYEPKFTYMGFRYIEIRGVPYTEGLIKAYALYSEMERTGTFECDHEKVQRVYLNQLWGMRSNYVEVPTDCPQRDERMGYTGDGQVFARTGMYNYDTREFWKKFLKDIRYTQEDNKEGYVPSTVPAQGPGGIGFLTMLGWASCDIIVPDKLYRHYGDVSFVRDQYESMKKLMDCEIRMTGIFHLSHKPNLGDWLSPGHDMKFMAMHHGPVSNSFIINDLKIMIRWADTFNDTKTAIRWREELRKIKAAYVKAYVQNDGTMKEDYQGAYVMALQYVLEESEELWPKVYAKLKEKVQQEGIATGFFATEFLLPLLADHGDAKLAYDLLLQENCPGWMYQVNNGATTIWERWDALRPDGTVNETKSGGDNMVSFNHYAFGSVGEFYYRCILGIREELPGFEKVCIRPVTDERLGSVRGSYRTAAGEIRTAWTRRGNETVFTCTTPSDAKIIAEDGSVHEVGPGTYTYTWRI